MLITETNIRQRLRRLREKIGDDTSIEGDRNDHSDHAIVLPPENLDRLRVRAREPAAGLSISLSPAKVARVMTLLVAGFVLLSLANSIVGILGGPVVLSFTVADDLSLPSWYSAVALLFASVLLAAIALATRSNDDPRYAWRWAILAAIFLFLSCDEMLRVHERIEYALLRPALSTLFGYEPTGILHYSWTIVYVPLLPIFMAAFLKFWLNLPSRIRGGIFLAGCLYVGGAVGVEMFNSWYDYTFGTTPVIVVTTHVEELLEMLGGVVLVYALMSYLRYHLRMRVLLLRTSEGASSFCQNSRPARR